MLNLCGNVEAILKMATARYDVPIYSRHSKISSGRHFQNGRHNTAQIQHYPISTTFHMWVDWRPVEIFQCRQSIRDIIIYPHIKF
jgi:hypothetical protein